MKIKKPHVTSPYKIAGGKSYLAKKIIPHLEYRPTYIEPFFGGGNIFFNIDEVFNEIHINDINPAVINLFKTIRNTFGDFYEEVKLYSPNSKSEAYSLFCEMNDGYDEPLNTLFINRFSRSANNKDFGWSDRLRRGKPEYLSAWETCVAALPAISRALRPAWIHDKSFEEFLVSPFVKDAIIYLDPPYVPDTRVSKKLYKYEMTTPQHITLIAILKTLSHDRNCVSYLSGYRSELYVSLLGEPIATFNVTTPSSQKKTKPRRVECLWKI